MFSCLVVRSYDYNMHVEGLLRANCFLSYFIKLEKSSQFERFHLQHVQMVNKISSFKTTLIGNNVRACSVNTIHFDV